MQSKILILFLMFVSFKVAGQSDTTVTLNQLQVPSTPALNMLGIAPNNIERPKNPTDFALALGNATSGFTSFPKDYAIELAPHWVFNKQKGTYSDFIKHKNIGTNILQTATLSAATTTAKFNFDSTEFRQIAFALKFSLFRGHVGREF